MSGGSTFDIEKKIGTLSVHVGSRDEESQDTPNYNCTSLSNATMLNTRDRNLAGRAQTYANCNAFFSCMQKEVF